MKDSAKGSVIYKKGELAVWTKLRNSLSYSAPEKFFVALTNLIEYVSDDISRLLPKICEASEIKNSARRI